MANDDIIQAVRPRLQGLLAEGEKLAVLKHPGVKGRLRELLIQSMIEPFLPPSVKVLTGTIVAPSGQRQDRTQDDLVLFSLERAPVLRHLGEQSIMPIRGVLAQIEVKSCLTRDDLRQAVKAATELRDLTEKPRDLQELNKELVDLLKQPRSLAERLRDLVEKLPDLAVRNAPVGIIFAYRSNYKQNEVKRLLNVLKDVNFKPTSGQATSPIQLICVADKGTWLLTRFNNRSGWFKVATEEEHHLLAFCSLLSNYCYLSERSSNGVGDYLLDTDWLEGPSPECPLVVP